MDHLFSDHADVDDAFDQAVQIQAYMAQKMYKAKGDANLVKSVVRPKDSMENLVMFLTQDDSQTTYEQRKNLLWAHVKESAARGLEESRLYFSATTTDKENTHKKNVLEAFSVFELVKRAEGLQKDMVLRKQQYINRLANGLAEDDDIDVDQYLLNEKEDMSQKSMTFIKDCSPNESTPSKKRAGVSKKV